MFLFDQWMKGDTAGFSALYERYKNRVFGFLVRMTGDREIAEDLLQDTFLAAMRNAEQFDRERNFLSWIFGIAHKRTIDYFRHVKVEYEHILDTDRSLGKGPDLPDLGLGEQTAQRRHQRGGADAGTDAAGSVFASGTGRCSIQRHSADHELPHQHGIGQNEACFEEHQEGTQEKGYPWIAVSVRKQACCSRPGSWTIRRQKSYRSTSQPVRPAKKSSPSIPSRKRNFSPSCAKTPLRTSTARSYHCAAGPWSQRRSAFSPSPGSSARRCRHSFSPSACAPEVTLHLHITRPETSGTYASQSKTSPASQSTASVAATSVQKSSDSITHSVSSPLKQGKQVTPGPGAPSRGIITVDLKKE